MERVGELNPVDNLYYDYIAGSKLEREGWTEHTLADWLEKAGAIQTMFRPPYDLTRFKRRRYYRVVSLSRFANVMETLRQ